jgi:dihydrolipoamide dehydrogenase
MAETLKTRLLVLGGGPGGYVAAIRAGQLGVETVLVEEDRLGGTCLIRGCIPSKALIHVADRFADMVSAAAPGGSCGLSLKAPPSLNLAETVRWKDAVVTKLNTGVASLLKRAKVKVVHGRGRFTDAKTCVVGDLTITADTVILATGSLPAALPHIPFGGDVLSSTEALSLEAPPERLVVVGAGYIGLELGSAFRKFGCAVAVVEAKDRILPLYDEALTGPVKAWLQGAGVEVHTRARAVAFQAGRLQIETPEGPVSLPADKLLVTVGRIPNTGGWGLESMGVDLKGPFIAVDQQCRTSMRGVFAVGDLVGEPMLEHKAAAQGHMVAEIIAGRSRAFAPESIAAVCFTEPEIVSAGATLQDLADSPVALLTGTFPFQANGRALSMDAAADGGFVRVIARKADHKVLGLQAVGRHVSELSAEFALAMEMGAVLEDLAGVIHVHPTLSEAVHEAASRALGHAVHI